MNAEIVITGMGLVLPCGDGLKSAQAAWEAQQPSFTAVPENLGTGLAGVCSGFSSAGGIPAMVNRRLDRPARFAWVAAREAFHDACLEPAALGDRLAMATGTMAGGSEAAETFMRPYLVKGPEGASPMVFPNCVAVSISGHLSTAFQFKGPSLTQIGRENSTLVALDQAVRWLRLGMADAALVVGTDGLFPLLTELLQRTYLSRREGLPVLGSHQGFLPGEGAQAFLLETRQRAVARGAPIRAAIAGYASCASITNDFPSRAKALREAACSLTPRPIDGWIAGSNGHRMLDDLELPLRKAYADWPTPKYPKLLWGEFAGSGGQLLAAALLDASRQTLITAPASSGSQVAMLIAKG
jgi:3-oxoacyl-[acyl-carrier-protein] synthase II